MADKESNFIRFCDALERLIKSTLSIEEKEMAARALYESYLAVCHTTSSAGQSGVNQDQTGKQQ